MTDNVLVINSGSVLDEVPAHRGDRGHGPCHRVDRAHRRWTEGSATHKSDGRVQSYLGPIPDHGSALRIMQQLFDDAGSPLADDALAAVGHRVVHGGLGLR